MSDVEAWIAGLQRRHAAGLSRTELLKAIRALSVRYVEARAGLSIRSPLDSAGKRAAFAAFYAPLHFLTVRGILARLPPLPPVETIVDLGCGTGVAGAAWALGGPGPAPRIEGLDVSTWALGEARHTWRVLDLRGRTRRGNLVSALEARAGAAATRRRSGPPASRIEGLVLGWSLNELAPSARARAIDALLVLGACRMPVLVIEPIATRLTPWWPAFAACAESAGGRVATWRLDDPLPSALADLDDAAGFGRDTLTAKSIVFG